MSNLKYSIILAVLIFIIFLKMEKCRGYRILGIFTLNSRSHMMVHEALMKGLARRGHQVDVINRFPQKTPYPNYTDIIIPPVLPQFTNNVSYQLLQEFREKNMVYIISEMAGNYNCEMSLKDPQIQNIIKDPPAYDLVIVELFSAHCFMAFGHHLKVPLIATVATAFYPWGNDMIANPENLAFSPIEMDEYSENMNFWQRLANVVNTVGCKMYFNYLTARQDEVIRKHFGPDTPGVRDLERSVSLVLANSHFSLNGVKSKTPALIEVGGLHIEDSGPDISAEDKKWLDESTGGFVYFTFGSMVTIESFPKSMLQAMYNSLGKIAPVRVFMKISDPKMLPPGLPNNIRTFSWTPQLKVLSTSMLKSELLHWAHNMKILEHKNIRAFITHGGLMSIQEAIYFAVPMLGIPLFTDQFLNVDICVKKKIAIRLHHVDITEAMLDAALREILHDPIYRQAVRRISGRFSDRPLSPIHTACYWVEYVIRHGNKALRSPALDLAWWELSLLDIYAFVIIIIFIIAIIIYVFIRFLILFIKSAKEKLI